MTLAKSSPSFKSPHSNTPREYEPTYGRIKDDREYQIAEDEKQGHAPREMPPVQTREKRFRTVPGERDAERRGATFKSSIEAA